MIQKGLPNYQQLPILSQLEVKKLKSNIFYYDQLIIKFQYFTHPGSTKILQPWVCKDICEVFHGKSHSFNAKLMLINLCVGRKSQKRGLGFKLFTEVKESKLFSLHQSAMSKIDLSNGILNQVSKLSVEEMQAFASIPKYFKNYEQMRFTESQFSQFMYMDRFWVSTFVFTVVFVAVTWYLYSSDALLNSFLRVVAFMAGIVTWTIIQYYFHRVLLHVPYQIGKILNDHLIHHAFPNFKNKLALSIIKNLLYQLIIYLVLVHLLGANSHTVIQFLLGTHLTMTLYDILHYYFHFGPEIDIKFLNNLKRSHLKHHFRDQNRGFGVTNTFWDWVFGTQHIS